MNPINWILIAISSLIMLYAISSFFYRLAKGKPFWPNLKKAIRLFFDGFWGLG